ncbi:class I SAM-dependent methyltransferase [Shewanella goraebulensis]|uniref:class I SAM-dependent methyltransferase n=1 Tax=Shewanella goraebulensis TaxID=3050637 RepID=UPI00254BC0BA|nr:class I SAM-dependent methyltransferase [Shewanella goraebulensis]
MSDHWSEYWNQGFLTSFGGAIDDNYEGALKHYWKGKFSELDNNFNMLDIGTGNGAIPMLLKSFVDGNLSGNVIGIDMAKVKLPQTFENSTVNIKLLSYIDCTNLPFDTSSFDKCTSQFAIEYSDLIRSLKEVNRVLKLNGEANFIMHNSNSSVIEVNKKANNILLSPYIDELFSNMSMLIKSMGEIKSGIDIQKAKNDPICEQYRHSVNNCIKNIIDIDEQSAKESELMAYVGQFFTKGMMWSIDKKYEFLAFVEKEILSQRLRLTELLSASIDHKKIITILENLPVGLVLVSINEVKEEHKIIAWELTLRKNE